MRHSTRLKRRSCVYGAIAAGLALFLSGCSFKGLSNDTINETKILNVVYLGGQPWVDKDNDGVFETAFSKADIEIMEAQGWTVVVRGETHAGYKPVPVEVQP